MLKDNHMVLMKGSISWELKVHMLRYMDKISINSNSLDVSILFSCS